MVENLGSQKLELLEKTTAMWVGLECRRLSVALFLASFPPRKVAEVIEETQIASSDLGL